MHSGQAFLVLFIVASLSALHLINGQRPIVRVGSSRIYGTLSRQPDGRQVHRYLGIRYGKSPTGGMRFRAAEQAPLPSIVSATSFGMDCPQYPIDVSLMSEDCLYLNIFKPESSGISGKRVYPVLVYVHGNDFQHGSSRFLDADTLVSEGKIIVVTFQYRLGVLGFLSTEEDALPGNYGLWDQHLALTWVKKFIQFFGGDVSKITLAGISSGAASVSMHSLSPRSRDLFHNAIQISGTALSPWARKSVNEARENLKVRRCFAICVLLCFAYYFSMGLYFKGMN